MTEGKKKKRSARRKKRQLREKAWADAAKAFKREQDIVLRGKRQKFGERGVEADAVGRDVRRSPREQKSDRRQKGDVQNQELISLIPITTEANAGGSNKKKVLKL